MPREVAETVIFAPKMSKKKQVFQYLEECYINDQFPTYEYFHIWGGNLVQNIPRTLFKNYKNEWVRTLSGEDREQWYNEKCHNHAQTKKSKIWKYLEVRYQDNQPTSYKDFLEWANAAKEEFPIRLFRGYASQWNLSLELFYGGDSSKVENRRNWFRGKRREWSGTMKRKVWHYLENCFQTNQDPNYANFLSVTGLWEEIFSKSTYSMYVSTWGAHLNNEFYPRMRIWYEKKCRPPTKIENILEYLTTCYENDEIPSHSIYLENNEFVSKDIYSDAKNRWKKVAENSPESEKKLQWFNNRAYHEKKVTAMVGQLFEKLVIAVMYEELRNKNIPLYYDIVPLIETGIFNSSRQNKKRTEIRLLRPHLLAKGRFIGPTLKDFLKQNPREELAIDVTLGSNYTFKIRKYTNNVTNLLIVTPRGINGQRMIEPNVRVLSLADLIGSQWFNLSKTGKQSINRALKDAFSAIRGGIISDAYRVMKKTAKTVWVEVSRELKQNGSQKHYRKRIFAKILTCLQNGFIPRELEALIAVERAAGRVKYSNRLEGFAQAIAGLAIAIRKITNDKQHSQDHTYQ